MRCARRDRRRSAWSPKKKELPVDADGPLIVVAGLLAVVAKLLVCTEAPEDGMASGGLFASQAVGSLNA